MKLPRLVLAAVLVAVSAPPGARAQAFEGVLRTRTISVNRAALERLGATTPEQVFAIPIERILALKPNPAEDEAEAEVHVRVEDAWIHSIKGSAIRSDPVRGSDTAWYGILDPARGTWLYVQPAGRRYYEFTSEQERARARPSPSPRGAARPATQRARPLGGTRTVSGLRATGYEVRSESEITRGWVTADQGLAALARALTAFATMWEEPAQEGEEADADELLAALGFPLLVQAIEIEDGEPSGYRIEETVSVERKALPSSLFAVPLGYRKVTLEQWVQEMNQRQKP